uniref:Esterase/lipase n=1 Tax=Kwoniella pini CBS 10737 TaxID=1296096 RepID=A0A1B9I2Y9_9TREE|nr:esterase/lipase [Kwoniella pini CBS 10737]OCF49920.1 esterase/lipase [Kwoniella pini CBS 10737]
MSELVTINEEWVLGPEDTPFYTKRWSPKTAEPAACFAEHITRYETFFTILSSPPYNLHITAFDQRGHGKTAYEPLIATSSQVVEWKKEGKVVNLAKNTKRRTGGWAKVFPDIEWFVKRESIFAKEKGKKLFLYGFSMGGAEVLAFATRPTAPPSKESVNLLSGVISGGPLIRQTKSASAIQVKAGSFAAGLGLGNMLIPTPMDYNQLSHNQETNDRCKADPFCEQSGSLRGVADMLNGGITLDNSIAWNAWPVDLPLLIYHGEEDMICLPDAAKRFGENAAAKDKKVEIIKGMYHEVHNELSPIPENLAKTIGEWVHAHTSSSSAITGAQDQSTGVGNSKL